MIDLKLLKALKIFLYPASKRNNIFFFYVFLLAFYSVMYIFAYTRQLEYFEAKYFDSAYMFIIIVFIGFFSWFMSIFPLIYYDLILNEKKAIVQISKFMSCNQLKNNIILLSFTATILTILPAVFIIIINAYLYNCYSASDGYIVIITILITSLPWLLFNILLMLFIIVKSRNNVMPWLVIGYTFFMLFIGRIADEYLNRGLVDKTIFFGYLSPSVYLCSTGYSNYSFRIEYAYYWCIFYCIGSLILYRSLFESNFIKSELFKFKT